VIAGSATAAWLAGQRLDSGNDAVPTAAISRAWKDDWTIAIASVPIGDAGHEHA
jgi:hypothetical protein